MDIPWMPDADECPIVQVEGFPKGNTKEDLLELFRKHNLLLDSIGESSVALLAYDESIWASGSYKGMLVAPQDLTFNRDEIPTEQAENVDLTYEEFIEKVNHDIELLTGFTLDNFIIEKTTVQGDCGHVQVHAAANGLQLRIALRNISAQLRQIQV